MEPLPTHVPPELVVESPLFARETIYEDPYTTIIRDIHAGPRVTYATNLQPGKRPGWLLSRWTDVRALVQDNVHFTKHNMARWAEMLGETWMSIPTETDPPAHTGYRQAFNPYFTPQRMVALSDRIRKRARALIADFKDLGGCEFVGDFASAYPVAIVLDMLGLPQERLRQFLAWERDMLHTDDMALRTAATRAVSDYLREEIGRRQRAPRDDYISRVLEFAVDGREWTADEVLGHCFSLYVAGLDSVTSHLGFAFFHLATHPADRARLRADPAIGVFAVEELLRAYAPVTSFRVVAKEIEFAGVRMMPGDYVSLSAPIAGRDPRQYDQPDEIRFDRKPSILTLGGGIHKCLGMHLVRIEMRIAIEEFLAVIPEFGVEEGFAVPFHVDGILHIPELRLAWA